MCDIKYKKACEWLCFTLVLLFAMLPGKLEARPRITTKSNTNSVNNPISVQERANQNNDQENTFMTTEGPEEIHSAESYNYTQLISISLNNQTKNLEEKTQDSHFKEIFQNEEALKSTTPTDGIETTTFSQISQTSSDQIDNIPIEFPSEKNNLYTVLSADDFPILTRKLRGENPGYFNNPIEITDSTYAHVPIEFPTQADSDITILHSKDHPIFINFLTNGNEGRDLSQDLEESSGNFGEETDQQANIDSTTNESVTDFQDIKVLFAEEAAFTTENSFQEKTFSIKQLNESNKEEQQSEEAENRTQNFTDELILPTIESSTSYNNDEYVFSTEGRFEIFEDSHTHRTGTTTKVQNIEENDFVELKLDEFFSTPSPVTTTPRILQENVLEFQDSHIIRNSNEDIEAQRNEEDYSAKRENFLDLKTVKQTEEPSKLPNNFAENTPVIPLIEPIRNGEKYDTDNLDKDNGSEIALTKNPIHLNLEKLDKDESRSITESTSFELFAGPTDAVKTQRNFEEVRTIYPNSLTDSLKILKIKDNSDVVKMLLKGSTSNLSEGRSFKENITSLMEEKNEELSEITDVPQIIEKVNYKPEENKENTTDNNNKDIQDIHKATKVETLADYIKDEEYPERIIVEQNENSELLTLESTTLNILNDGDLNSATARNVPDMIEFKHTGSPELVENDEINSPTTEDNEMLLLDEIFKKSTEDWYPEHEMPVIKISVEPSIEEKEEMLSAINTTIEELQMKNTSTNSEEELQKSIEPSVYSAGNFNTKIDEIKHISKNEEETQISGELSENSNDFEEHLLSISKTESSNCCTSIFETAVINEDDDGQQQEIMSKNTNSEKAETSSDVTTRNYEVEQANVEIGFKFDGNAEIIKEEGAPIKVNEDDFSNNDKLLFEDTTTPKEKVHNFETNDNLNEVLEQEIIPYKKPKVFSSSKKYQSSEETSSSEEHFNKFGTKKKIYIINTTKKSIDDSKSSSESVESYEVIYVPPEKRFPFKSVYQGRAFSDANEDMIEHLQPFKEIGVEETDDFVSTDHAVIKKSGILEVTLSPLLYVKKTTASSGKKEETTASSKTVQFVENDKSITTLPSFTEIIVEAAELTTDLSHEIESFHTTDQTTVDVFEETFKAIGSTISTELDKNNLGDALLAQDMKETVVASDMSSCVIASICIVGIVVVLALLITTWYKIRNSGHTFDIQLEEQRHRKEHGSQPISVSD